MIDDWMRDVSGLAGLPVCLAATAFSFLHGERTLAAELAASLLASYAVTWPLRLLWHRARPDPQRHATVLERIDASSFPSLHALRGGAFWTVLALYFGDPWTAAGCLTVIVLTAWSRVRLRRHHRSDVLVGALLGLVVGWLVTTAGSGRTY